MANNQDKIDPIFPFVIEGKSTPHLAKMLYSLLDQDTLAQCRVVCKPWKNFVDHSTNYWGNISPAKYCKAAEEGKLDICKLIIQKTDNKNPTAAQYKTKFMESPTRMNGTPIHPELMDEWKWTPLHIAAMNGKLEVCRLILDNIEHDIEEIMDGYGWGPIWIHHPNSRIADPPQCVEMNPLHLAAMEGQLEVCQLFLETFGPDALDKETYSFDYATDWEYIRGWNGLKAMHFAAYGGHIEVVRLFIHKLRDQIHNEPMEEDANCLNPRDEDGLTPLHMAAHEGHVEVCRLIMDNIDENKYHRVDNKRMTPLDYARKNKPTQKSERKKLAELFGAMQL